MGDAKTLEAKIWVAVRLLIPQEAQGSWMFMAAPTFTFRKHF